LGRSVGYNGGLYALHGSLLSNAFSAFSDTDKKQ
jgi:hypothetical protein